MVRENRICPKTFRKVGLKYPPRDKHDDAPFNYMDVICDAEGWADVETYLPGDYDLVIVKVEGIKPYYAWFTGSTWDGLKYKREHKIVAWRREIE